MQCPNCGATLKKGKCDYCGYDRADENINNNQNGGFNLNINIGNDGININGNGIPNNTTINQGSTNYNVNNNNTDYDSDIYSNKNKWVALILAIFFGGFGIHKFYVGKIGMGILYLLTGGLFYIGVIVDVVNILTGSAKDSEGKILRG